MGYIRLLVLVPTFMVVLSSAIRAAEVDSRLNAKLGGGQRVDQRLRAYRLTVTKLDEQDKTEALETSQKRDTGSATPAQVRSVASELRAQKTRRVVAGE